MSLSHHTLGLAQQKRRFAGLFLSNLFVPHHIISYHTSLSSLLYTIPLQEGVALEIAEAVIGALRGDLAATAVNAPMVPAEVLPLPRKKFKSHFSILMQSVCV